MRWLDCLARPNRLDVAAQMAMAHAADGIAGAEHRAAMPLPQAAS